MPSQNPIPSKTEVLGLLRDCGFDPRNQLEMRALTLVSKPDYLATRAMELIDEATIPGADAKHFDNCMVKAIRLITLARIHRKRETDATQNDTERR